MGRAAQGAARQARDLVRRVKHAAAIRSARKERGMLSVTVDPETLDRGWRRPGRLAAAPAILRRLTGRAFAGTPDVAVPALDAL